MLEDDGAHARGVRPGDEPRRCALRGSASLVILEAQRWRLLLPGGPEHASHRLRLGRYGSGGQDGVAAVNGAGRCEQEADGVSFAVLGGR